VERLFDTQGHVLVAFNNASAVDTVRLLENFARSLLKKRAAQGGEGGAMFDQILSSIPNVSFMAQRAAQAAGLEFVPNPEETLAMARSSMSSPSVRLVKFKDDDLDMVRLPRLPRTRSAHIGTGLAYAVRRGFVGACFDLW
jgi:hypothetical protein